MPSPRTRNLSSPRRPNPSPRKSPEPKTTADPDIPVDQINLRLQPFTKDELTVEAQAWRDLLKK